MKLKKANAVLALLSALTLLIHMGYNTFAYLTFFYDATLKILTAIPFLICVCLHAICGMCTVFLQGDGTRLDVYQKMNRRTVIQRVSAALFFPLLIIHMRTFNLLKSSSDIGQWSTFAFLIFLQILFFAVVVAHTAVSFTKAFITLGMLNDRKKQRILDLIVYILGAVMFVVTVFGVVKGELAMFLPR